jgi:hypothetical protein
MDPTFFSPLGRVDRHQTGGFGQSVAFADGHACCGSNFYRVRAAAVPNRTPDAGWKYQRLQAVASADMAVGTVI